jgi:hypothetical protein
MAFKYSANLNPPADRSRISQILSTHYRAEIRQPWQINPVESTPNSPRGAREGRKGTGSWTVGSQSYSKIVKQGRTKPSTPSKQGRSSAEPLSPIADGTNVFQCRAHHSWAPDVHPVELHTTRHKRQNFCHTSHRRSLAASNLSLACIWESCKMR